MIQKLLTSIDEYGCGGGNDSDDDREFVVVFVLATAIELEATMKASQLLLRLQHDQQHSIARATRKRW